MVEKIWDNPEIYCIPVDLPQNPLRALNSYVIKTGGKSLIIDTGFNRPECRKALWDGIRALELDLSQTIVFLTHLHSDHTGLALDFVAQDVPLYISRIDYNYFSEIKKGRLWPKLEALYEEEGYPADQLALQNDNNQGRLYAPERLYPAVLLEDGDCLPLGDVAIECILTPGHTPGHMAIYLPEQQILFSGDHILFDITPNISVWGEDVASLSDYMASLRHMRQRPVRTTFPAHRARNGDMYQRIDALIEHHDRRLEEIYQCLRLHEGATAYEVAGLIKWSARGLSWENFPPHQKWFAMSETLAHLYYLAHQGRVLRTRKDDRYRYYLQAKESAI